MPSGAGSKGFVEGVELISGAGSLSRLNEESIRIGDLRCYESADLDEKEKYEVHRDSEGDSY
jgi:hypothetical protein